MFEFSVAFKYLIPRKKSLSTALISLVSIGVISLVVWLVVVFLSVTTGIEKNWLEKLTSMNAPLRIAPTNDYYSSYYYQVDGITYSSNYSHKTIGEKALSQSSDPYLPNRDMEIPADWPKADRLADGTIKDPVKRAFSSLEELKERYPDLIFQDYEISGALMRLSMNRTLPSANSFFDEERTTMLTQMSYLLSLSDQNPRLPSLTTLPSIEDLNHMLIQLGRKYDVLKDSPEYFQSASSSVLKDRIQRFFQNVAIAKLRTNTKWSLPLSFIPENAKAFAVVDKGRVTRLVIPAKKEVFGHYVQFLEGKVANKIFTTTEGVQYPIDSYARISTDQNLIFDATIQNFDHANTLSDVFFSLSGKIQDSPVSGTVPFVNMDLYQAEPKTIFTQIDAEPLWSYYIQKEESLQCMLPFEKDIGIGVLIPKSYRDNGVLLGDRGYLSYAATTTSSTQEQRIAIYVAGFYDPGIMPVGNRCLFVPPSVTRTINAVSSAFSPEGTPSNGIFVWFKDLSKTDHIKDRVAQAFSDAEIDPYWNVKSFKEFEFSKDLMEQFQSDRTLFTLIALIILLVACSNIISMLILLVNDKKKEIASLQAMGATPRSISAIFGLCGVVMGALSSLIGVGAAILTLRNLQVLVAFLSNIQGRQAFNATFFGEMLPNQLSMEALLFVLIATPILSLIAGLIPAIKAARIKPSSILRSE